MSHLDDIGLVNFAFLAGFQRLRLPEIITVAYHGIPLRIEFEKEKENELLIGKVILTKIGQQLAPICGSRPVDGFQDYVIKKWIGDGLILSSPYPNMI